MAHRSYPSPDGKSSLIVEMESGAWLPCRLAPLDAASPGHPVGPTGGRCTFAGWSPDGKWMYFSSSSADESFHTWRQRYPDGQLEQITSGPTEEEGFAMFPDGRSFVTSVALKQSVGLVHDASGDRQVSRSVSTVASTSRQVKGSGTGAAPVTFNSRSAASGFGPRATIRVRARRAVKSGQTSATAAASARVPTPVSRMTTSTSAAARRRVSSRAAGLRGSEYGVPSTEYRAARASAACLL